jgi:phenylacetate-CoA ligase
MLTTADRSPLLTPAGERMLKRLHEHPDAPRFNYVAGDRLRADDRPEIERFREALHARRARRDESIPQEILERVERLRNIVPFFRRQIRDGVVLSREWHAIPTSSRADLAARAWEFVPDDEDLDRLIIYRTAGTTGHPISVPHHPIAIRFYEPMIEYALQRHGARITFDEDSVGCFLVGAQVRTYTYATVLYNWNGAGFAKLNIRQTEWPRDGSQRRYFGEFAPKLLSGDPVSFAEMMRLGIEARPAALVTTAVAMSPSLKKRLSETYRAPLIDWYSMVETGPVAYACPRGHGYHVLPHDIHVEVLKPDGTPTTSSERGEITLTGGRNRFVPLLRYRTGDFGRIDYDACPCGDPMPRLMELEGRVPVLIRSSDGTPVTTVDLSRLLREFPLLLHEFSQASDLSCELIARALPDANVDVEAIETALRGLLGTVPLKIRFDPTLGERSEGKAMPYRSELMLED